MSNLQVVDAEQLEADLTSVADSIRAKTGGEEKLAFPSGFESALDTIESADSALAEVEYLLSNGYTDYSSMFQNLAQMTEVPEQLIKHLSNSTNCEAMFSGCTSLTVVPALNTVNSKSFNSMFSSATMLRTIEGIDFTSATQVTTTFQFASNVENLTVNGVIKVSNIDLTYCSRLTHDSLMSAINALYDYASEGSTSTYTLRLGRTNLAKLTDAEKAIATQKGWTLL